MAPSPSGRAKPEPLRWPPGVRYIDTPIYHSSMTAAERVHIGSSSPGSKAASSVQTSSRSLVIIKSIVDPAHPARGQFGLFAAKKIPARTRILYYLGEVHSDNRPESDYDLSLYRTQYGVSIGIDASRMGNEARFINDYRSVRDKPNASFEDDRSANGELRMSVWSKNLPIQKGEEILVSYGKSWWRERQEDEAACDEPSL